MCPNWLRSVHSKLCPYPIPSKVRAPFIFLMCPPSRSRILGKDLTPFRASLKVNKMSPQASFGLRRTYGEEGLLVPFVKQNSECGNCFCCDHLSSLFTFNIYTTVKHKNKGRSFLNPICQLLNKYIFLGGFAVFLRKNTQLPQNMRWHSFSRLPCSDAYPSEVKAFPPISDYQLIFALVSLAILCSYLDLLNQLNVNIQYDILPLSLCFRSKIVICMSFDRYHGSKVLTRA